VEVAPPIIVIQGSDADFAAAVAEVRTAGWSISDGFDRQLSGRAGVVCCGEVASADDAAEALMAALAGAGVVILGRAKPEILDHLLGDLRHVGEVEHRRQPSPPPGPVSGEGRAIMRLLAAGETLGQAARQLGLSRRTADRRLADARRALGAERTAEALARARRLGWLD
jgi:DNA-binding NarL/FixJ family response regulator